MKQPLFPSAEIMDDATALLLPIIPGGDIFRVDEGRVMISDPEEVRLWAGRTMDGRRVNGTYAGVDELPRLVPEMTKERLS